MRRKLIEGRDHGFDRRRVQATFEPSPGLDDELGGTIEAGQVLGPKDLSGVALFAALITEVLESRAKRGEPAIGTSGAVAGVALAESMGERGLEAGSAALVEAFRCAAIGEPGFDERVTFTRPSQVIERRDVVVQVIRAEDRLLLELLKEVDKGRKLLALGQRIGPAPSDASKLESASGAVGREFAIGSDRAFMFAKRAEVVAAPKMEIEVARLLGDDFIKAFGATLSRDARQDVQLAEVGLVCGPPERRCLESRFGWRG